MATTRLALLLLLAGACGLAAQSAPQPSAAKESFIIEPGNLPSGARNAAIRFATTTAAGFTTSSAKLPQVKLSAGAELVPGSFVVLNQNEAECRVNIGESAFGTIEVRVELYGVNGSSVLKTLRGTLGVTGPQPVSGSAAKLAVEEVRLVRVNVTEPQTAGAILISGKISGAVSITAPTGTTFVEAPVATTDKGDINSPALGTGNSVFTFSIGNPGQDDVTVRVANIKYMTALFSAAGGIMGDLACEVGGAALANQSALVVNAFTAKTTIEGKNDIPTQPPPTTSQPSPSTSGPTGGGGVPPSAQGQGRNAPARQNRANRRNESQPASPSVTPSSPGGAQRPAGPAQPAPAVGAPGGQAAPAGGGQDASAKPAPAAAPTAAPAGAGSIEPGKPAPRPSGPVGTLKVEAKQLVVTPGLHFCDKDFNPISAVVLNRIVSGEAGGRVWIVLKLDKDRNPDRVDTVTVKLTLGGVSRELQLTETGKNTGEFRCSKEGVLLIAQENPDSNEPEAAKVEPKPRFTNR
ncbi:MAG: hypothetical protein KF696_09490 [Planctomycetes bacterium]|nr:hypothetical protein [Planctomycetota bacterium]